MYTSQTLYLLHSFSHRLFQCTEKNGCGVHIHKGFDCENTTTQGGHFFVDPATEDPWVEARYSSNADGKASFSGIVDIGATDDLQGLAFLGTRPTGKVKGMNMSISTYYLSYIISLLYINQSMRRMGHAWDVAC